MNPEKTDELIVYPSAKYAFQTLLNLDKLRKENVLCDVELEVGSKSFHAHRAVLAASSQYFQAMFTLGLSESTKSNITLHCIDEEAFSILLDFIYTGTLTMSKENVQHVAVVANMLQLPDVTNVCCTFLTKMLHPSNCLGIHYFADIHHCTSLKDASENFIHSNFYAVMNEQEFLALTLEQLKALLQSENLNVESEEQIFTGVMNWLFHDLKQRRKLLFQVLKDVRLPVISMSFLETYVTKCEDLSVQIALKKLLEDHVCEMMMLSVQIKAGHCIDPRTQPRHSCMRRSIIIIGGFNRDTGMKWIDSRTLSLVEKYDVCKKQWKSLSSMLVERKGHGTAFLNGTIYVFGGECDDSLIFSHGEAYNCIENKWTFVSSMIKPRTEMSMCTLHGRIYALGGWVGSSLSSTVECYDPELNSWNECGNMTIPRYATGIAPYQGLIYLVGGMSELGIDLNLVESYNPITQEWCQLEPLPYSRAFVGVAVLHNHLYVVGGSTGLEVVPSGCRYSFENNRWEEIPSMKWSRAAACVAAVNGLLYVIGGHTSGDEFRAPSTLDVVEFYNPETNLWSVCDPMPSLGRSEAGTVVM